jgi:hypothetical protein
MKRIKLMLPSCKAPECIKVIKQVPKGLPKGRQCLEVACVTASVKCRLELFIITK